MIESRAAKERFIATLRPGQPVKWIGRGNLRDVALVGETECFRFPRTETARLHMPYEVEILQIIGGRLSVHTPQPIVAAPDGAYNILGMVSGRVLTTDKILTLPVDKQQKLGTKMGQLIAEFNDVLDPATVREARANQPPTASWDSWYVAMKELAERKKSSHAAPFAQYLDELQKAYPQGLDTGDIVVFGDFHAGNLIVSDADELVGIIDFAEVNLGNIYRELRPMYALGENVLRAAIKTVDPRFGPIDFATVRVAAIVHELAMLIELEDNPALRPGRAARANKLLTSWLGKGAF